MLAGVLPALGAAGAVKLAGLEAAGATHRDARHARPRLDGRDRHRAARPRRTRRSTRASRPAARSTTRQRLRPARDRCATSTGARRAGSRAGASLREWELVARRQGDRGRARASSSPPGPTTAASPGPTLRCREGERLRITFVNGSAHPHTIHFHGIHPAEMDGVPGHRRRRRSRRAAAPSTSSTRSRSGCTSTTATSARSPSTSPRASTARSSSTRRDGRADADELVMVMNGFDTELRPRQRGLRGQHDRLRLHGPSRSRSQRDELVRVYLVNVLEYDLDQLVPPARQPLPLLPDRHVARARPSSPTR